MFPKELLGLMHMAAGADWHWAAAVAQVESEFNPFAVPIPANEAYPPEQAKGLWQMKPSFLADMLRAIFPRAETLFAASGNPFVEAAAFRAFWTRYTKLPVEEKLRIFHYGATGGEKLMEKAQTALATDPQADVRAICDPDGYVAKVTAAHDEIVASSATKKAA